MIKNKLTEVEAIEMLKLIDEDEDCFDWGIQQWKQSGIIRNTDEPEDDRVRVNKEFMKKIDNMKKRSADPDMFYYNNGYDEAIDDVIDFLKQNNRIRQSAKDTLMNEINNLEKRITGYTHLEISFILLKQLIQNFEDEIRSEGKE